jgi:septal ring factor EnvC (AmiA/AmiB activator)
MDTPETPKKKSWIMKAVTYAPLIGVFFSCMYGGVTTWLDVKQARHDQKQLQFFVKEYDKDLEKVYSQFNIIQQDLGKMKFQLSLTEDEVKVVEDEVVVVEEEVVVVEEDVKNIEGHLQIQRTEQPPEQQRQQPVYEPIQRKSMSTLKEEFHNKK